MSTADYSSPSIIGTATILRGLQNISRSRIGLELNKSEVVVLLINTSIILTVLLDSVELEITEVDRALVECINLIKWLNRVLIDQNLAGD